MSYKARQCYVIMRKSVHFNGDSNVIDILPVAVFYDLETAEGNAEGYNLSMKEQDIKELTFYVATTASYE